MFHRRIGNLLATALLTLLCSPAFAALSGTFTVAPTSGNAPLGVTLSWSATGFTAATTCAASGSWTGSKATSGSQGVTNLLSNASYTLTCTTPAIPPVPVGSWTATLSWQPPTENTDGSALTNLAGFRILYGDSATALNQSIDVPGAGKTSYIVDILTSGTKFFTVRAYASTGAESVNSNIASKSGTVTAGSPGAPAEVWTKTVAVTVTPQPAPPVLSVAANAPAYKQNVGNADKVSMITVGKTKTVAPCDPLTGVIAANTTYNLVLRKYVITPGGAPLPTNILQTFARCQRVG